MVKKLAMLLVLVLALVVGGCVQTEQRTGTTGSVTDVTGTSTGLAEQSDPNLKRVDLTVYRVQKNGDTHLIPETVKYAPGTKTLAEAAMDALVNTAPTSKKLMNVFPKGTKVLGVKVDGDTATVNFNKAFASRGQGSYNEMMMVNAVVCTLTELKGIKQVRFLVEGKPIDTISGHEDLGEPLKRLTGMIGKPLKENE
ncbi:MAG: GerMN domain-containing protein [Succiniclasticum sp.]|jgi:germination protein M